MDDLRIVQLFKDRSETAIEAVSQQYGAQIRQIALNVLGNEEDAAECENDTYMRAWESIPPNDPGEYLFPYLAKIARGIAISRFRAQSAQKRSAEFVALTKEAEECIPGGQDVESQVDGKLLAQAVSSWLSSVSSQKRAMFVRRYWYMDSIESIASRCRCSTGKVKSVLFRMRKELKERLIKEGFIL